MRRSEVPFRGTDLVRVIAAPRQQDQSVRILTLELYEDGLIVRYVLPQGYSGPQTAEEATLNPLGPMSFTIQDDAGTAYAWSGGSSGGHPVMHGMTQWTRPRSGSIQRSEMRRGHPKSRSLGCSLSRREAPLGASGRCRAVPRGAT